MNYIAPIQLGFKSYSCTTALMHVTDDILRAFDDKLCTVLLLLDFTRAFVTINYNVLITILNFIRFTQSTIKLFDSYF